MNCLAIDTVTPALSIIASGPRGKYAFSVTEGGQHAPALLEAIDTVMNRAGFTATETSFVAVPEGPGSFTGLRLAWSAAKGISLAANCPVIPIPTLDTYALRFTRWTGPVVSVLDAKKARFYARVFRRGAAVTDSLDISAGELRKYVTEDEQVLITGPDAMLFSEEFSASNPLYSCFPCPFGEQGMAGELLFLAQSRHENYTDTIADYAGPLYVRRSDAENESSGRGK